MIISTTAAKLEPGDVLSTDGSTINFVQPFNHDAKVYVDRTYEDGHTKVECIASDTPVHIWRPDPS